LPAYGVEAQRVLAKSVAPYVLHLCVGPQAWQAVNRLRASGLNPINGVAPAVVCLPPGVPWRRFRWDALVAGHIGFLRVCGCSVESIADEAEQIAVSLLAAGAVVVWLGSGVGRHGLYRQYLPRKKDHG